MPRNLYPSHTGRFGGLNRQLMYARGRTSRFRNRAYGGYDLPSMPEGVAGDEWHPEAYKTSEMWSDVEQRLHEILRNPPKFHRDPQTEAEKDEEYQAQMANNPQIVLGRERNAAMLEASGDKAGEKDQTRKEKEFQNAMAIVKGKEKNLFDIRKANAANKGTFSKEQESAALEAYNGALRAAHKKGKAAGWEGLEESYPEIATSGLTKRTQAEVDRKEEARKAARERQATASMDPLGNIMMSRLGLPDIFPGGIPDVKAIELLERAGGELDRQLEAGTISRKQYDEKVKAITEPTTAAGRASVADTELSDTPAVQQFYQEQQPPAKLPQSLAGREAGVPGSDRPGVGMDEFPSPETPLLGEGEEQMPAAGVPGPEGFMESTPEQMARIPDDRYDALNLKLFNKLPPREEIGRVPRSVGGRGRYPYRRGGQKRERVREE